MVLVRVLFSESSIKLLYPTYFKFSFIKFCSGGTGLSDLKSHSSSTGASVISKAQFEALETSRAFSTIVYVSGSSAAGTPAGELLNMETVEPES